MLREAITSQHFGRPSPVAVRSTTEDGRFGVFFCAHKIADLNLDEAVRS